MKDKITQALGAAGALGIGMLAMYLLDPDRGRRRRALAADKFRGAGLRLGGFAGAASRDAAHRGHGVVARMRSHLFHGDASMRTIEERVRARIGRAVSNPGAVDVTVLADGTVTLAGPLLRSELNNLISAVWSVSGVCDVDNQLELHEHAGNVPELQGARAPGSQAARGNWPPAVRLFAGTAGAAAVVAGLMYRPFGVAASALGSALMARSIANRRLREIVGFGGAHAVHVDKDMFIAAAPERVFEFWRAQENLPRFMRNVLDVQPLGDDRWHWKVAGPAGSAIEWDAEVVDVSEGRCLAWRTLPGPVVEHEGRIDIVPEAGGTRLRVSMDYAPAAGVVGHAIARLFGKDAKTEIDEDLMRMKSFLETGVPPRDAARQTPSSGDEVRSFH